MLTLVFPIVIMPLISILSPTTSWLATACSIFFVAFLSLLFFPSHSLSLSLFSLNFFLDSISLPLITLTLWISGLMLLASYRFLTTKDRPKTFLITSTLLMSSLILFFSTSHLLLFYIFFEASLVPTLFLILLWGVQPERLQASMYLMLYTVAASLPLLISLFLIFNSNSSMFMNFLLWEAPVNSLMVPIWWAMTITAFLVKMPMFSLHLWLPKAHVEAPLAGSMVLAAILLKLGSYGLIRLSSLFPLATLKILSPFVTLCLLGACVTGAICIRQTDMKALIAYSSIGHMGLLTAAIFTLSKWGWEGALVMMIAHGLSSSAMFCMANSSYEVTHTRSLYLTKGLLALFPSMALLWFMICAANMSAPPSINLMGEIMLLAPVTASSLFLIPFLILACLLTGTYTLILFSSTQHGHPSNFISPLMNMNPRNFLLLTLHILPLFLLILLSDFITISI